jgi:hypothetical protein
MSSRSAEATIKGYYYQFDTSILKLLELVNGDDKIYLERIEDVDIETATEFTAVQCKYLSKPRFINSAVREPIELMIRHFVSSKTPNLNYILYAHFTEETGGDTVVIDLDRLKEILTYTEKKVEKALHIDCGISDAKLSAFLNKFKFVFGDDFNVQQSTVIKKIQDMVNCDEFEADSLHYNNALRLIIDKSCLVNANERYITRKEFYDRMHLSIKLFNNWYVRLRSKKEHLLKIRKIFHSSKADLVSKSKLIIIGKEILSSDNSELPICVFIENLIYKFYRLKQCFRDAKPLTVVLETTKEEMNKIKKCLAASGHLYNDGYEDVHFNVSVFNTSPVINLTANTARIHKSSFVVKLVRAESFAMEFVNMQFPKVVIHCSQSNCPYLKSNEFQLFDVKHCTNLQDVSTILI